MLGETFESYHRRPKTFGESVIGLVFHLVGAAVIFVSFFTLAWLVSYLLHWLHGIHKFPDEIFYIVTRVEVWTIYADAILCAIVLLAGALRFCREVLEVRR